MRAEIISVGTELLMGDVINTDAAFIARQLPKYGIDLYHQITVGDNPGRLTEALEIALSRADLVFATGGLGPTPDDLTKETVAQVCKLPMERDEASFLALKERFGDREITPNNFKQVDFPKGSIVLPNPNGTAPGCIVPCQNKHIVILPGPPRELEPMFENSVEPFLRSISTETLFSVNVRTVGIGESELAYRLRDLIEAQTSVTIATYIGDGDVAVRLSVKCKKDEDPMEKIAPIREEIIRRVGTYVYSTREESPEKATARLLIESKMTLSVAESCTGGMVSAALIDNAGISANFMEGCVTYSNEAKMLRLGVPKETLQAFGAVSEQTALAMAQGIRKGLDTQIGLSTTGIAGPDGGTEEKPVGLVYIGIVTPVGEEVLRLNLRGNRNRVRRQATLHALSLLRKHLLKMQDK